MSLLNVLYMGRKVVFMIVNKINIQDIKPYENNAKKHDETQIKNVADVVMGITQVSLKTLYEIIILPLTTYFTRKASIYESKQ